MTTEPNTPLSRVRRKMGFLFQDAALFDSITLYENLALPLLRLTTKTQEEIDSMIDKVLSQVGLATDKKCLQSFREACGSAPGWHARWCSSQRFCSRMNPAAVWIASRHQRLTSCCSNKRLNAKPH
jgi:ABC-type phosphate transport system ATPase subunit